LPDLFVDKVSFAEVVRQECLTYEYRHLNGGVDETCSEARSDDKTGRVANRTTRASESLNWRLK